MQFLNIKQRVFNACLLILNMFQSVYMGFFLVKVKSRLSRPSLEQKNLWMSFKNLYECMENGEKLFGLCSHPTRPRDTFMEE